MNNRQHGGNNNRQYGGNNYRGNGNQNNYRGGNDNQNNYRGNDNDNNRGGRGGRGGARGGRGGARGGRGGVHYSDPRSPQPKTPKPLPRFNSAAIAFSEESFRDDLEELCPEESMVVTMSAPSASEGTIIEYLILTPMASTEDVVSKIIAPPDSNNTVTFASKWFKLNPIRENKYSVTARVSFPDSTTTSKSYGGIVIHVIPDIYSPQDPRHHPYLLTTLIPTMLCGSNRENSEFGDLSPLGFSLSQISQWLIVQGIAWDNIAFLRWVMVCYLSIAHNDNLKRFDAKINTGSIKFRQTVASSRIQVLLDQLISPKIPLTLQSIVSITNQSNSTSNRYTQLEAMVITMGLASFFTQIITPTMSFNAGLLLPLHSFNNMSTQDGTKTIYPTPEVTFLKPCDLKEGISSNPDPTKNRCDPDNFPILVPFDRYPVQNELEDIRPRDYTRLVSALNGLNHEMRVMAKKFDQEGGFDDDAIDWFSRTILPSPISPPSIIPTRLVEMEKYVKETNNVTIYDQECDVTLFDLTCLQGGVHSLSVPPDPLSPFPPPPSIIKTHTSPFDITVNMLCSQLQGLEYGLNTQLISELSKDNVQTETINSIKSLQIPSIIHKIQLYSRSYQASMRDSCDRTKKPLPLELQETIPLFSFDKYLYGLINQHPLSLTNNVNTLINTVTIESQQYLDEIDANGIVIECDTNFKILTEKQLESLSNKKKKKYRKELKDAMEKALLRPVKQFGDDSNAPATQESSPQDLNAWSSQGSDQSSSNHLYTPNHIANFCQSYMLTMMEYNNHYEKYLGKSWKKPFELLSQLSNYANLQNDPCFTLPNQTDGNILQLDQTLSHPLAWITSGLRQFSVEIDIICSNFVQYPLIFTHFAKFIQVQNHFIQARTVRLNHQLHNSFDQRFQTQEQFDILEARRAEELGQLGSDEDEFEDPELYDDEDDDDEDDDDDQEEQDGDENSILKGDEIVTPNQGNTTHDGDDFNLSFSDGDLSDDGRVNNFTDHSYNTNTVDQSDQVKGVESQSIDENQHKVDELNLNHDEWKHWFNRHDHHYIASNETATTTTTTTNLVHPGVQHKQPKVLSDADYDEYKTAFAKRCPEGYNLSNSQPDNLVHRLRRFIVNDSFYRPDQYINRIILANILAYLDLIRSYLACSSKLIFSPSNAHRLLTSIFFCQSKSNGASIGYRFSLNKANPIDLNGNLLNYTPSQNLSDLIQRGIVILAVVRFAHLLFTSSHPNLLLGSFTGSGKTVICPLLSLLLAYANTYSRNTHYEFIPLDAGHVVLCLPSPLIVNEKYEFFQNFHPFIKLQLNHTAVTQVSASDRFSLSDEDIIGRYKPLSQSLYHPQLIILTPQHTIQLIKQQVDINPLTLAYIRVILDEAHERRIEGDVLLSQLLQIRHNYLKVLKLCRGKNINEITFAQFYKLWGQLTRINLAAKPGLDNRKFHVSTLDSLPSQLVLMSATPDDDLLQSLGIYPTFSFDIPSQRLYDVSQFEHKITTAPTHPVKDGQKFNDLIINSALWAFHDMYNPQLGDDSADLYRQLVTASKMDEVLRSTFPTEHINAPRGDIVVFLAGLAECNTIKYQFNDATTRLYNNRNITSTSDTKSINESQQSQLSLALRMSPQLEIVTIPVDFPRIHGTSKESEKNLQIRYKQVKNAIEAAYHNLVGKYEEDEKEDEQEEGKEIVDKKKKKKKAANLPIPKKEYLFVIPVPVCNMVPQEQKDFATKPLPEFIYSDKYHVAKLILATSAIESSITIPNLSIMIDSGKSKIRTFDPDKQVSILHETTITNDSRTQRSGRVGRITPGTAVSIIPAWEGSESLKCPEIQSIDITSKLLTLRQNGIYLEELKNLPTPIIPTTLVNAQTLCKKLGLLSTTGTNDLLQLTLKGIAMLDFVELLNPVFATVITNEHYQLSHNQELTQAISSRTNTPGAIPPHRIGSTLFSVLFFLVISSFNQDKIYSHNAFFIRACHDNYSDLVTVLNLLVVYFSHRQKSFSAFGSKFRIERYLGLAETYTRDVSNSLNKVATALGIKEPYDPYFQSLFNSDWQQSFTTLHQQYQQQELVQNQNHYDNHRGLIQEVAVDDEKEQFIKRLGEISTGKINQYKYLSHEAIILAKSPQLVNNPSSLDPTVLSDIVQGRPVNFNNIDHGLEDNENNYGSTNAHCYDYVHHMAIAKYDPPTIITGPKADTDLDYYHQHGHVPMALPCTHQFHKGSDPQILENSKNSHLFSIEHFQDLIQTIPNPLLLHFNIHLILGQVNEMIQSANGLYKKPGEVCQIDSVVFGDGDAEATMPQGILAEDIDDHPDINRTLVVSCRARYSSHVSLNNSRYGLPITLAVRPGGVVPNYPKNATIFGVNFDATKSSMNGQLIHTSFIKRPFLHIDQKDNTEQVEEDGVKKPTHLPLWANLSQSLQYRSIIEDVKIATQIDLDEDELNSSEMAVQSFMIPDVFNTSPFALPLLQSVLESLAGDQSKPILKHYPSYKSIGSLFLSHRTFVPSSTDKQNPKRNSGAQRKRDNIEGQEEEEEAMESLFITPEPHQGLIPQRFTFLHSTFTSIPIHIFYRAVLFVLQALPYVATSIVHIKTHVAVEQSFCPYTGNNTNQLWLHTSHADRPVKQDLPKILNISYTSLALFLNRQNKIKKTIAPLNVAQNDLFRPTNHSQITNEFTNINELTSQSLRFVMVMPPNQIEGTSVSSENKLPWKDAFIEKSSKLLPWPEPTPSTPNKKPEPSYPTSARLCLFYNSLHSDPQKETPSMKNLLAVCHEMQWGSFITTSPVPHHLLLPGPSNKALEEANIGERPVPEAIDMAELLLISGGVFHSQDDGSNNHGLVDSRNKNLVRFNGLPPILFGNPSVPYQLMQSPGLSNKYKSFITKHPLFSQYVLDALKLNSRTYFDQSSFTRHVQSKRAGAISTTVPDIPIIQTLLINPLSRFMMNLGNTAPKSICFEDVGIPDEPINNIPPQPIEPVNALIKPVEPSKPKLPPKPVLAKHRLKLPQEPKRPPTQQNQNSNNNGGGGKKGKNKKNNNKNNKNNNKNNKPLDPEEEKRLDASFKLSSDYLKYLKEREEYDEEEIELQSQLEDDTKLHQDQLVQIETAFQQLMANHKAALSKYNHDLAEFHDKKRQYQHDMNEFQRIKKDYQDQCNNYRNEMKKMMSQFDPIKKFLRTSLQRMDGNNEQSLGMYLSIHHESHLDCTRAADLGWVDRFERPDNISSVETEEQVDKDPDTSNETSLSLIKIIDPLQMDQFIQSWFDTIKGQHDQIVKSFNSNRDQLELITRLLKFTYLTHDDLSLPLTTPNHIERFFGDKNLKDNFIEMAYSPPKVPTKTTLTSLTSQKSSNETKKQKQVIFTLLPNSHIASFPIRSISAVKDVIIDRQGIHNNMYIGYSQITNGIGSFFNFNPIPQTSLLTNNRYITKDDINQWDSPMPIDLQSCSIAMYQSRGSLKVTNMNSKPIPEDQLVSVQGPKPLSWVTKESSIQFITNTVHEDTLSLEITSVLPTSNPHEHDKWKIHPVQSHLPLVSPEKSLSNSDQDKFYSMFHTDVAHAIDLYIDSLKDCMKMDMYEEQLDPYVRSKYVDDTTLADIRTDLVHRLTPSVVRMANQLKNSSTNDMNKGNNVHPIANKIKNKANSTDGITSLDLCIRPISRSLEFNITNEIDMYNSQPRQFKSQIMIMKVDKKELDDNGDDDETDDDGVDEMTRLMAMSQQPQSSFDNNDDDDDDDDENKPNVYVVFTSAESQFVEYWFKKHQPHDNKKAGWGQHIASKTTSIADKHIQDFVKLRFNEMNEKFLQVQTSHHHEKYGYAYNPLFTIYPNQNNIGSRAKLFCQGLCDRSNFTLLDLPSFYTHLDTDKTSALYNMTQTISSNLGICLECCLEQAKAASSRSTTYHHMGYQYQFDPNSRLDINVTPVQSSKVELYQKNYSLIPAKRTLTTTNPVKRGTEVESYNVLSLPYPTLLTYLINSVQKVQGTFQHIVQELLFRHFCEIRYASDQLIATSVNVVVTCPGSIHRPMNYNSTQAYQQALLDVKGLRQLPPNEPYKCCDKSAYQVHGAGWVTSCGMVYCSLCDLFHKESARCVYTSCHTNSKNTNPGHTFNLSNRFLLSDLLQKSLPTPCPEKGCTMIFCTSPKCRGWHRKNDPDCDITKCPCNPDNSEYSKMALARTLSASSIDGTRFLCPNCHQNSYCLLCTSWHEPSIKCININSFKMCPRCKTPTDLRDGCSHITCHCGSHWCYKCPSGRSPDFSNSTGCYQHLSSAHGGYF